LGCLWVLLLLQLCLLLHVAACRMSVLHLVWAGAAREAHFQVLVWRLLAVQERQHRLMH
jgi:hypothetical protein